MSNPRHNYFYMSYDVVNSGMYLNQGRSKNLLVELLDSPEWVSSSRTLQIDTFNQNPCDQAFISNINSKFHCGC